jgi:hypothetical protein
LTEEALDVAAAALTSASSSKIGSTSSAWLVDQLRTRVLGTANTTTTIDTSADATVAAAVAEWPEPPSAPLFPAGRIVHLVRTSERGAGETLTNNTCIALWGVPDEMFSRIYLGPTMLSDHLASAYSDAIRESAV